MAAAAAAYAAEKARFRAEAAEAKAEAVKYITDIPCLAGQGTPDLSSPPSTTTYASSEPLPDLLTS